MILASASPQRRAILTQAGIPFRAMPAAVEEETRGDPHGLAAENARRKALAVPGPVVLGADTVVAVDGEALGKPRDAAQAREYLGRLAGRAHEVVGGIALVRDGVLAAEAVAVTEVCFRGLSAPEIDAYVALGEWESRAGGYAIQGRGAVLVRAVRGDYLNVVGLPLARLLDLLGQDDLGPVLGEA